MKKIIVIIVILAVGIVSCSKTGKVNKKSKKRNIETVSKKPDILKISYEDYMKQRMEDAKKDVLPEDVTGQMLEVWKSEIAKLYNLLLVELSDKEREKLRVEQKEWEKKVNTEPKEKKLEKTEKKAIEMAKRYDKIRKK
ncbi:lysozyme inhibitor LprI family protein [Leptotrichia shahii]|uniref:lysozyme inhibitor LprI family protein n=1 Tax=Leptotrichia shahii TaxID=157691 RepID=UPI0028D26C3D|nr:lysozyme inhibitor LprI family protein [Leptotrichia shahii]